MKTSHRYELKFSDGSSYSFIEEDYDAVVEGTWNAPYSNTQEDSQVFGMIETWAQGESSVTNVLWDKGEPVEVKITLV
jgi:hypothetical protein